MRPLHSVLGWFLNSMSNILLHIRGFIGWCLLLWFIFHQTTFNVVSHSVHNYIIPFISVNELNNVNKQSSWCSLIQFLLHLHKLVKVTFKRLETTSRQPKKDQIKQRYGGMSFRYTVHINHHIDSRKLDGNIRS